MGIFRRLRRKVGSSRRRVRKVVRSARRNVRRRTRSPVRKSSTRIRRSVGRIRINPTRRNVRTRRLSRPRMMNRRTATRRIRSTRIIKRVNRKSISIFGRLKSATGKALSRIKKTRMFQPKTRTSLSSVLRKIKLTQPRFSRFTRKRKEAFKGKRNIFSRIKSISKKLATGIKQNYILPVGFGIAKVRSARDDTFRKFFGGAKKTIGSLVRKTPLFQISNPNSALRSRVGDWFAARKEDVSEKAAGFVDRVKDFFQRDGDTEEGDMTEAEKKSNLIRNVAIGGGIATLGYFLLRKK